MSIDEKTKAFLFDILTNGLLTNSKLSYYEDYLNFDNDIINNIFKIILPHDYYSRIEDLKRKKEEEKDD